MTGNWNYPTQVVFGPGTIKKLADVISEQEEALPEITWDAETHQGYKFHRVSVPVPEPEAAALLGDEVEIVLAVAADSCYLAAGGDSRRARKMSCPWLIRAIE